MNRKAKGSRAELEAQHLLEALGYSVCKAGASLGVWDLIATHPTHVRFIQVKSNRRPGGAEMEAMRSFRSPPGASRELWIRHDGEAASKGRPARPARWVVEVL